MKHKVIWSLGSFVVLILSFIVIRFVSFEIHLNTDWSVVMFIFGLVVLIIATIAYAKRVMICTVIGYSISFAIGTIFDFDVVISPYGDIGGAWFHIWTFSFIAFILIGVIWDVISRVMRKRKILV